MTRDILNDPPLPRSTHSLVDAGGSAVVLLTLALFIAPMTYWALKGTGPGSAPVADFEIRMLLWCALLALLLPLIQIYLQIKRHGGAAVRGNRARFQCDEGAAGRVGRAHRNLIESLVPFGAVVLAAHALGISTPWTIAASAMFLGARLVHAVMYVLGITVIRSAAFYASLVATVILVAQLYPLSH